MNSCFAIEQLISPTAIVSVLTGTFSLSFNPTNTIPEFAIVTQHSVSLYKIPKSDIIDTLFTSEYSIYGSIMKAVKIYWPSKNKNIITLLVDGDKVLIFIS